MTTQSNQYINQTEILETLYNIAEAAVEEEDYSSNLSEEDQILSLEVVNESEQNKGLLAVLLTLFCQKVYDPNQDIRKHQASFPDGFAARTIDTKHVTPFLKSKDFPAMAESGWLTRAFEHPEPYTLDYKISLKKKNLGEKFLRFVHNVEVEGTSPQDVIIYIFKLLIKQRNDRNIDLVKPHNLNILQIIKLLERHFNYKYAGHGASRLPTLAIYAAYKCMMKQVARYEDKILCNLESHTSSDARSGQIGDIQVNFADGTPYEGIEIKHLINISPNTVRHAFTKLMPYRTDRYYILTTANMDSADWDGINKEIDIIEQRHGCQVIVNGVYSTIKYYLRLLKDPAEFTDHYVELLKSDENVKYPQKVAWNEINLK